MKYFIFFILFPLLLSSQDYLWPTNASKHLTSTFCEYRPGHYHSAIDIKTWNREGYPCYAVADGRIVRVRVSPFGYGKAVYILLDDGRTAVYAHLQKFSPELDESVRQYQLKKERYSVQWYPKNLKVKKGDIIGYTGQTGIGVPHLHFEIRDKKERPLNPLKFYNGVKDKVAPTLKSLLIIPANDSSRVNGSYSEQFIKLQTNGKNNYKLKAPLKVFGQIGLAVEAIDRADGVPNRYGVYRTVLKINDKAVFHKQYDRMSFATTGQIDIDIHYPAKVKHNIKAQKLYIEDFNELSFYDRSLGSGLIAVKNVSVLFQIEISDFAGNTSTLSGALEPDLIRPPCIQGLKRTLDFAFVQLELPAGLKELHFSTRSDSGNWHDVQYFEVLGRTFLADREIMLIKIKTTPNGSDYLRIAVKAKDGQPALNETLLNKKINQRVKLNIFDAGKYLVLQFDEIRDEPDLNLKIQSDIGDEVIRPEINGTYFEHVLSAAYFNSGSVGLVLSSAQKVFVDTVIFFHRLDSGRRQKLSFFDDRLRLSITEKCLYDTMLIQAHKLRSDTFNLAPPLFSPVFEITSNGQILNKPAEISLRYSAPGSALPHLGLYKMNGDNGFSLIGTDIDTLRNYASARIKKLGKFVVAADTVAPELAIISPRPDANISRLSKIRFETKDELSGIGTDENINVRLDGQFVLPEWDPETDRVTARPHWRLKPGKHEISIRINDSAGNTAEKTYSVMLTGNNHK